MIENQFKLKEVCCRNTHFPPISKENFDHLFLHLDYLLTIEDQTFEMYQNITKTSQFLKLTLQKLDLIIALIEYQA